MRHYGEHNNDFPHGRQHSPGISAGILAMVLWDIPVCGLTDIADGIVARKTNTACESGARLDSIADFLFAAAVIYKLLPALDIPKVLLIWICLIAVIKIVNIISGFVVQHTFVGVHSVPNKITGVLLFLLPLSLPLVEIKYSGYAVCLIATIAAIQEGHIIRTGK